MTRRKNGYVSKLAESLFNDSAVPAVPTVPAGFNGHDARAREGAGSDARARHVVSEIGGYSGYSGYSSHDPAYGKRESAVPTFSEPSQESGYSGYSGPKGPLTDRASLNAAMRLPVRHLAWLPARLTCRFEGADGVEVVWTTHPGVYEALRGSEGLGADKVAAFSPKEFEAAVAAGESGVASERSFAGWVAEKLAAPAWRLGLEEALRWAPRWHLSGIGWWPGAEWCEPHDITPERGWTLGYAAARFGLTPVSVEVHASEEVRNAA